MGLQDELLEERDKLLVQEKESNQELKKLLKLEKEKREKHDLELVQSKETCRGLIPWVPWVTGYGPIIQIRSVPTSSKFQF
jgi:hypothetical protein